MRLLIALSFLLGACTPASLQQRTPVVVFLELAQSPNFIYPYVPTFVLYRDGLVVYQDRENKRFVSAQLTSKEKRSLLRDLALGDLRRLDKKYLVSRSSDDTVDYLLLRDGIKKKKIYIYGGLRPEPPLPIEYGGPGTPPIDLLPAPLRHACQLVIGYRNARAAAWSPDEIELWLWDRAPYKESVPWPARWPAFSRLKRERRPGYFNAYLSAKYLDEIKDLEKQMGSTKGVLINGQIYALRWRYALPNEDWWPGPNRSGLENASDGNDPVD